MTYLYNNASKTPEKRSVDGASPHTDDGYVCTSISEQERQKRMSPEGDLWYCGPKSDSDGSTTKLLGQSGKTVAEKQSDTDLFGSRCVLCVWLFSAHYREDCRIVYCSGCLWWGEPRFNAAEVGGAGAVSDLSGWLLFSFLVITVISH